MASELKGRRVAILATDGVEQIELQEPRRAVEEAGAAAELLSLELGEIQGVKQDIHPTDRIVVDREVSDASADEYDALLLPGRAVNPDKLRMDQRAVSFVREFCESGKPVGVICT